MAMLQQPAGNDQGPVAKMQPSESAVGILRSLRAVILMAGSVRPSKLDTSIGRSVMELPLTNDQSLIGHWQQQASGLAHILECDSLAVRVMVDRTSTLPTPPNHDGATAFHIERDPLDYRGTGGVLHDLSADYDDDDYLLVANAQQVMVQPLGEMAERLAARGGEICVVGHRDGTPSGLMLVRCGVLRTISDAGFVDMKEQALPAIAREHSVRVVQMDQPSALPVRTLSDYIHALRVYHMQMTHRSAISDPFAENLHSTFTVVEAGAKVDSAARLHDSVVLRDGRVDLGAIVVRSLVCPDAIVGRNQRTVDRLVAGPRRIRERGVHE